MKNISNLNTIQILYGLTIIKIYYIQNEFYLNLIDLEKIIPCAFKTAKKACNYIVKLLENQHNIDVRFFFRTDTPIEKKIKVMDLNGHYSNDGIDKLIYRALLLLIN